jgi:hypothetical protein
MTTTDRDHTDLDDLFAEARARSPALPSDLMARILADADTVSREHEARRTPLPPRD